MGEHVKRCGECAKEEKEEENERGQGVGNCRTPICHQCGNPSERFNTLVTANCGNKVHRRCMLNHVTDCGRCRSRSRSRSQDVTGGMPSAPGGACSTEPVCGECHRPGREQNPLGVVPCQISVHQECAVAHGGRCGECQRHARARMQPEQQRRKTEEDGETG